MSEVDFNSILDTPVEEIVAKPPVPVGSYKARIKSLEPITSSQKKTPGVRFQLALFEALEDVDQDLLKESGGLKDRELKHELWVTPDSASMLKDFLISDVGLEGTGRTLRQLMAECINAEVGVKVIQVPSKDGKRMFANIQSTFRL